MESERCRTACWPASFELGAGARAARAESGLAGAGGKRSERGGTPQRGTDRRGTREGAGERRRIAYLEELEVNEGDCAEGGDDDLDRERSSDPSEHEQHRPQRRERGNLRSESHLAQQPTKRCESRIERRRKNEQRQPRRALRPQRPSLAICGPSHPRRPQPEVLCSPPSVTPSVSLHISSFVTDTHASRSEPFQPQHPVRPGPTSRRSLLNLHPHPPRLVPRPIRRWLPPRYLFPGRYRHGSLLLK